MNRKKHCILILGVEYMLSKEWSVGGIISVVLASCSRLYIYLP